MFKGAAYTCAMPHLNTCLGNLRRLIAKGNLNGSPLAERAINEYWDVTPEKARKSGLRLIQQDVLDQQRGPWRPAPLRRHGK